MNCKVTILPVRDSLSEPPFEYPFIANDDGDVERGVKTAIFVWRQTHPGKSLFDDYTIRIERA